MQSVGSRSASVCVVETRDVKMEDDDGGRGYRGYRGYRPELWEHPPPRPGRREGWRMSSVGESSTWGDDSSSVLPTMPPPPKTLYPWRETDEDDDDADDVVYELDAAWAARFAATEKIRAARAKERARQNAGGGGRGGRGGHEGNATGAMGRAPRAEGAATRAEALMRRSRVRGDGGGDEEDVGPSALARARKVELYGEVGAIEVGRLEAELNAAFDAWMDAGDAAYFPAAI